MAHAVWYAAYLHHGNVDLRLTQGGPMELVGALPQCLSNQGGTKVLSEPCTEIREVEDRMAKRTRPVNQEAQTSASVCCRHKESAYTVRAAIRNRAPCSLLRCAPMQLHYSP